VVGSHCRSVWLANRRSCFCFIYRFTYFTWLDYRHYQQGCSVHIIMQLQCHLLPTCCSLFRSVNSFLLTDMLMVCYVMLGVVVRALRTVSTTTVSSKCWRSCTSSTARSKKLSVSNCLADLFD